MKILNIVLEVAATTAQTFYFPVPSRGNIADVKAVFDAELDADETVTISRGATAVNVVTPTDALAAGTVLTGVADATNGKLVFSPSDSTVANRVLKIAVPNTFDTAGSLGLSILWDDGAYVPQAAALA